MLAETIRAIAEMAQKSDAAQVQSLPGFPARLLVRHNGKLDYVDVPPPERQHVIRSLPDFVSALTDAVIAKDPEVYFSMREAVAFLDRKDRRETIRFPITPSDRWTAVQGLQSSQPMTTKEAIRLLRFDLHGSGAESVIQSLRRVDFTRTSAGKSTVEHGKESFGRSVEAAVQQADSVPESFCLHVSPAVNVGLRGFDVSIRIGVMIDLEAERILLRPLADELLAAQVSFSAAVRAELSRLMPSVPVFDGAARAS